MVQPTTAALMANLPTSAADLQPTSGAIMITEGMTTTEAAEALGVAKTTLKTWLDRLPIPMGQDSRGRRIIGEDGIAVLQTIRSLREEDNGYATIRRKIEEEPTSGRPDESTVTIFAADLEPASGRPQVNRADTAAIVEAVTAAIASQTDMAERYARATYRIGELEATVKAIEGDRDRVVIDAVRDRQSIETDRDQLVGERDQLAQELSAARALLAIPPARPWWRFW
jgi:DNA-binding transcriptional MerR regulator